MKYSLTRYGIPYHAQEMFCYVTKFSFFTHETFLILVSFLTTHNVIAVRIKHVIAVFDFLYKKFDFHTHNSHIHYKPIQVTHTYSYLLQNKHKHTINIKKNNSNKYQSILQSSLATHHSLLYLLLF